MHVILLLAGRAETCSVPQLVEDYLGKKVKVDEFVSHTFTLTDINQAFDVMHQGKRYVDGDYVVHAWFEVLKIKSPN